MQLRRLEFHPGFPAGNTLRCPAFSGDKWGYLVAAFKHCLPTFKVVLNASTAVARRNLKEAKLFCDKNNFGYGLILKAGFCQNQSNFPKRCIKDFNELSTCIQRLHTNAAGSSNKIALRACDTFDYLLLQPRVSNTPIKARAQKTKKGSKKGKTYMCTYTSAPNESKVLLHGGVAQFAASCSGKTGVHGQHSAAEIYRFCEEAVKELSRNTRGAFLCDGISRVDVFTFGGKMYVNEFENLDAEFPSTANNESSGAVFLVNYYREKIEGILKKCNFC